MDLPGIQRQQIVADELLGRTEAILRTSDARIALSRSRILSAHESIDRLTKRDQRIRAKMTR
jgi:hypothetical protein